MTHELFPGERELRDRVRQAVRQCARERRDRRAALRDAPRVQWAEELDELRVAMARARRARSESGVEHETPFAPLDGRQLTVLERQMSQYEDMGRLTIIKEPKVHEHLDLLRVNQVCGIDAVGGRLFFATARRMCLLAIPEVLLCAVPVRGSGSWSPEEVIAALPWRSALLCGASLREHGVRHFAHYDLRRDEETLLAHGECVRFPSIPSVIAPTYHALVCDPMLATGGTLEYVLQHLEQVGIPANRMTVFSVIAAPEGVEYLLHAYPELRIITCALDTCLNARGYITGPGLGDFGDLALRDIDAAFVREHWVLPGLLTNDEAERVLRRTHGGAPARVAAGT